MISKKEVETSTFSFGLGTVQIGLPYGNKAKEDLMPLSAAFDILSVAVKQDICFWDTATGYGESEARIGKFLQLNPDAKTRVLVSTKLPRYPSEVWQDESKLYKSINIALEESEARLGMDCSSLVQLHQSDIDFVSSPTVFKVFKRCRDEGRIVALGVSVYDLKEAEAAIECLRAVWIQAPVNLVDRRFLDSGFQALRKRNNVKLMARSVVLQGLLVDSASVPDVARKRQLEVMKEELVQVARSVPTSLQKLALQFIARECRAEIDIALLGADSALALQQNLEAAQDEALPGQIEAYSRIHEISEREDVKQLCDPRRWNSLG